MRIAGSLWARFPQPHLVQTAKPQHHLGAPFRPKTMFKTISLKSVSSIGGAFKSDMSFRWEVALNVDFLLTRVPRPCRDKRKCCWVGLLRNWLN